MKRHARWVVCACRLPAGMPHPLSPPPAIARIFASASCTGLKLPAVDRARSQCRQRGLVLGRGIAFVLGEAVAGVTRAERRHHAVALDLGDDGSRRPRSGRSRRRRSPIRPGTAAPAPCCRRRWPQRGVSIAHNPSNARCMARCEARRMLMASISSTLGDADPRRCRPRVSWPRVLRAVRCRAAWNRPAPFGRPLRGSSNRGRHHRPRQRPAPRFGRSPQIPPTAPMSAACADSKPPANGQGMMTMSWVLIFLYGILDIVSG